MEATGREILWVPEFTDAPDHDITIGFQQTVPPEPRPAKVADVTRERHMRVTLNCMPFQTWPTFNHTPHSFCDYTYIEIQ
jgi:hypothetical protein